MVQNSRMVLPSPMCNSERSPAYFLSWGIAPIELNWKIWLSCPMRVWPSMTQCAPTRVPRPMQTSGPTTEYGPMVTDGSIWALGSTSAVG
jgi:hypothetical protein